MEREKGGNTHWLLRHNNWWLWCGRDGRRTLTRFFSHILRDLCWDLLSQNRTLVCDLSDGKNSIFYKRACSGNDIYCIYLLMKRSLYGTFVQDKVVILRRPFIIRVCVVFASFFGMHWEIVRNRRPNSISLSQDLYARQMHCLLILGLKLLLTFE